MSMTVTQTQIKPVESQTRILKLLSFEERIKNSVHGLFKYMSASPLLENSLETIQICWESFQKFHLHSLKTDKEKMAASESLCFLICEVIYPALKANRGKTDECLKLQDFSDEITAILNDLLPANEIAEKFVEEYVNRFYQEETFSEQLEIIELIFQTQLDQLYKDANTSDELIHEKFDSFKKKLLEFNESRKKMTTEDHKLLDELNARMAKVVKDHLDLSAQIKESGKKMIAQVQQCKQTFESAQNLKRDN